VVCFVAISKKLAKNSDFFPVQRQMWEVKKAIEVLFFGKSMNLLWTLEVYYPIGPKESIDYPKLAKSVSKDTIIETLF